MEAGSRVAGKYLLQEVLGQGGCGVVWRARHVDLGEDVALKLIHEHLADGPAQERFLREVRATKAVVHRYAVPLRDFGRDPERGVLYFTMDLVPGRTLQTVLREQGRLEPWRAVRLGCQVLQVLEEAHAAGLIHRDLKPANIMLTAGRDGREEARVLDFGIAKAMDASFEAGFRTQTGQTVGTLEYMSPEQLEGEELDGRSDLYSLGVVLFEALSGERPVPVDPSRGSRASLLVRLLRTPPRPLAEVVPDVPPALAAAVMRALARPRDARFPDAAAFRSALEALDLPGPDALETLAPPTAVTAPMPSPAPTAPSGSDDADRAGLLNRALGVILAGVGIAVAVWSGALPGGPPRPTGSPTPTSTSTTTSPPLPTPSPTRAPTPKPPRVPAPLREDPQAPGVYLDPRDGSRLVWIPPAGADPGFFLGQREVTWAQYRRFCQATGRALPDSVIHHPEASHAASPREPVFNVSYADAQAYARWAKLRLPSAAEWRRAVVAGGTYPWGEAEPDGTQANFDSSDRFPVTAPVGSFPAGRSPQGCDDLLGNVAEWVGPSHTAGGGWNTSARLGTEVRALGPGWERGPGVGFRVAR